MEVLVVKGRGWWNVPAGGCRGVLIIFFLLPGRRWWSGSAAVVKGGVSLDHGEHPDRLAGAGDQEGGGRPVAGDVRVMATRGQTDMRGLVTAGRAVRLERPLV